MTERRRRKHAAAASRVLVAGLSTAATFGLVAGLAGQPDGAAFADQPSAAVPATPRTSVPSATDTEPVVVVVRAAPADLARLARPRPGSAAGALVPVTRSDGS